MADGARTHDLQIHNQRSSVLSACEQSVTAGALEVCTSVCTSKPENDHDLPQIEAAPEPLSETAQSSLQVLATAIAKLSPVERAALTAMLDSQLDQPVSQEGR